MDNYRQLNLFSEAGLRFLSRQPEAGKLPRKIDVNDVFRSVGFTLLLLREWAKKTKTGPSTMLAHPRCLRRSFRTPRRLVRGQDTKGETPEVRFRRPTPTYVVFPGV